MNGELGILNVGAGDTKLTFDKSKPEERKRAAAIVKSMLERGFAIMIQVGEKDGEPIYQRAKAFDPETCEYIIFGLPEESTNERHHAQRPQDTAEEESPRSRRGRTHRVPAESTRAVGIARSAGG